MKRKLIGLCLIAVLTFTTVLPVQAETRTGDPNWSVTFTSNKEMSSNFKTSNLNDVVSEMQPGDNVILTVKLSNDNKSTTDWYMTNRVVRSMEDNSVANGGAYTYRLTYTPAGGSEDVLYDSDTVGGRDTTGEVRTNGAVGLHEATGSLEDYFFIDTLKKGESGTITLEVALDGETQGNSYQDTLADLTMNFAVEQRPTGTNSQREPRRVEIVRADTVRTADDNQVLLFTLLTLTSGIAFLILALYCRKIARKEEE